MGTLRGTREYVTGRLWAAQQAGQDVVLSNPRVLPDGRWEVEIRARQAAPSRPVPPLEPPRATPPRESRRRAYAVGAAIGAAAAVLGITVWALLTLAAWVASHVAELVGLAVTLALLGAAAIRVGGGRSGHCSGPNSGH